MTEAEWCESSDPKRMLGLLQTTSRAYDRQQRVFALGCGRALWHQLTDPRSRRAIDTAERALEGLAGRDELEEAVRDAIEAAGDAQGLDEASWAAAEAVAEAAWATQSPEGEAIWRSLEYVTHWAAVAEKEAADECRSQSALLRCVFGNPFRSPPALDPSLLERDPILKLARAAYEDRSLPAGTLDPACLAVLADALEEAGCRERALLDHCREQGTIHVRGCWVLDLILRNE
jgi:hypothetical protein